MNVAVLTLPSKDWWKNLLFLQKYGIKVIGGSAPNFPVISVGTALKHSSGIIAKVRCKDIVPCSKDSVCTKWEIRVTNGSCPQDKFQEVFYDFLNA